MSYGNGKPMCAFVCSMREGTLEKERFQKSYFLRNRIVYERDSLLLKNGV